MSNSYLIQEIANRLSHNVDLLDFTPFANPTDLVLLTRKTVQTMYPNGLDKEYNAEYVVEWQEIHRKVYASLLIQAHEPITLLDMLLKQEETKTVKSIRDKVSSAFFGRD
jgi:hypothetical protein